MFEVQVLDHVALGVRNVEQSARWYCDVLGFRREHEGLWNGVPVFVVKGDAAIALFPAEGDSDVPDTQTQPRMLHFAMRADRKNFLAAQALLEGRGIRFDFQDHEVSHSIYFRDPDGHKIEITTYELQ